MEGILSQPAVALPDGQPPEESHVHDSNGTTEHDEVILSVHDQTDEELYPAGETRDRISRWTVIPSVETRLDANVLIQREHM